MSIFDNLTSVLGKGPSRFLQSFGDEALWDLIKVIVRRLGGRMNEDDVREVNASGETRVSVDRRVEKVDVTDRLARVMAKMHTIEGGSGALSRLLGYIADAVTGDDPLPGGEDELSRALARFIPPGDDDAAYVAGAKNLIAIARLERDDFYAVIRVATKDPALEDIKRIIEIAVRVGVDMWSHADVQFAKWAKDIRAGTAIAELKREARGKPNPSTTEKDLREEYIHLASAGFTKEQIMAVFRARGYTALLERSPR